MKAFLTGLNGQDASYLAELLLDKGYEVHGMMRRTSEPNTSKVAHLLDHIEVHYGDMVDSESINRIISQVRPVEIYNLAAQSHVRHSYDMAQYTFDVNASGLVRILESVRQLKLDAKIYQACSSEMFGKVQEIPQTESTPFYPRSPYGASKVAAYYTSKLYREAYELDVRCGILFNHESPRRGLEFLSRKVCNAVANIANRKQEILTIGNMDAKRDFGYAKEYVEWIYKIMQHSGPDDFVIATGENHSVREWIEVAFNHVGINISWTGEGADEKGYDDAGNLRVNVNPKFYRPAEVDTLIGDYSKSKKVLGFEPSTKFKELVKLMTEAEL